MVIKGIERLSLSDYPGLVSCVVFTPGCNLACPFCHNRDLVLNSPKIKAIPEQEVFEFLGKRKGMLDGVVVTGGEPTLQKGLPDFLKRVKSLGYQIKLDSNGLRPRELQKVINLIDFLAMDVKTELASKAYSRFGLKTGVSPILKSLKLAAQSKIPVELRTTVVPKLHDKKTIQKMATDIAKIFKNKKDVKWYLQTFRPGTCLDENFNKEKPYSKEEMQNLVKLAKPLFPCVYLR